MLNVIAAGSLAVALVSPVSAPAAETQSVMPDGTAIEVITVNGSGCPAAKGVVERSSDNTAVTVTIPAFAAWVGEDASPTDFRKNCQINLSIKKPAGWTYSVTDIESAGFAFLAQGASSATRVSYYFAGSSPTAATTHSYTGPLSSSWRTVDSRDDSGLVWAPCGVDRNLNINTELRVSRGSSDPSVDSFMVRNPATSLNLLWQRCPSA